MSNFASRIQTGKRKRPRLTVLYGTHGIGKTTWASKWPSPLFLAFEDGCADLDVASFVPSSMADAWGMIMELGGEHDLPYQTVVVDSADWLEASIQRAVCEQNQKESLSDFGYGDGFKKAGEKFSKILSALSQVRENGLHVLVLAHCEIISVREPGMESYDKYAPKLHKTTSALLQEWADEVLFARYETLIRKEDLGFNKKRGVATGGSNRVLHCQEAAGWLAKNRLGLPATMAFDFDEYSKFLV